MHISDVNKVFKYITNNKNNLIKLYNNKINNLNILKKYNNKYKYNRYTINIDNNDITIIYNIINNDINILYIS